VRRAAPSLKGRLKELPLTTLSVRQKMSEPIQVGTAGGKK